MVVGFSEPAAGEAYRVNEEWGLQVTGFNGHGFVVWMKGRRR